ncbi:calcium uniporter protein 6 [Cucumis melo var. makuwa]|uniref:Calcium uniporter protein 6 n=1 Tax=Cucumis melo var. makuwa TaxID=1194695 RepID=A0A5A7TTB3_CUCMM|nr:calcium uniporter protein 6 [Cucumis melo var. makuwa]TYK06541.1 calcium uniporter protein 6 [Cucumis melo var. makuwa]
MWRKCCSSATSLFVKISLVNGVSGSSSLVYYGTLSLSVEVSFIPSPPSRRDVDKSESGDGSGIRSMNEESGNGIGGEAISFEEAKRLMRLVTIEALKMKLGTNGKEVI